MEVQIARHLNNDFHHLRKAATTFPALAQDMIDGTGGYQAPHVLLKQFRNRVFNLCAGDDVAATNDHFSYEGEPGTDRQISKSDDPRISFDHHIS